MDPLIECIPNFSEGRDPAIVTALVSTIRRVPGISVLDQEMDHDHHRSVLTFVGHPDAVAEAAFQAVKKAVELIDLRRHQGSHPRIGAADVVPLVPIRNVTMQDCVALARAIAARIGGELQVPIFLYERAASRPDRTNLEVIRRGGLEGLGQRLTTDPAWLPDYGPPRLHPTAGATVVGARMPLIAFNVNLSSEDVEAARAIAKKVRFSSGGLPCVKAIGVPLATRRLVQVSMNLTNYEETPIHAAYEAVREEAERLGLRVAGTEIVGLIPQPALVKTAEWALRLETFSPSQVLENRLAQMLEHPTSVGEPTAGVVPFLDALAADRAVPGGGSAAALAGALAAALGLMVCRIARRAAEKASGTAAAEADALRRLEGRLCESQAALRRLIDDDARSYSAVLDASRRPKEDPGRTRAIEAALEHATRVPLQTADWAAQVAGLLDELYLQMKPRTASDWRVGRLLALAALEGGLDNASINMQDAHAPQWADVKEQCEALRRKLVALRDRGARER